MLEHPAPAGARLPRLARRPGGGIVLNWVEATADGHALKFAANVNGTWSAPVEVARGANWFINWIDLPSIVPIDHEFWVAHWLVRRPGGEPMDYDISLAVSTDGGRRWGGPQRPYRSETAAQYGFVSIFPDAGAAGIAWIDGREYSAARKGGKSGNFALRHARVHRDGRIERDAIIDPDVCSCCQTAPAATSRGPVLAYRGRTEGEVRDNLLALKPGGAWRTGAALGSERWEIAGCPTNGPSLASHGDEVFAAWYTAAGGKPLVRAAFSGDGGRTLGKVVDVDDREPMGRLAVEQLDASKTVIAWIGEEDSRTGDAPLLLRTMDRTGGPGPTRLLGRVSTSRDSGVIQVAADGDRLVLAWALPRPGFGIRVVAVPLRELAEPR